VKRKSQNKGKRTSRRRKTRTALRNKADRLFSAAVRERDDWACRNCGSVRTPQCAHIVSRRYNATRWSMDNAVCLCQRCHMKFTHDVLAWEDWVVERFGEERYQDLKFRARQGVASVDLEGIVKMLEGKDE